MSEQQEDGLNTVGGNAAQVVWKAIKDIEEIDANIAELQTDQKEVINGLKKKDLPIPGLRALVARHFKDEEKVKEQIDELALAGTLLGVKIPTRFDKDRSISHLSKEAIAAFKNAYASLIRLKKQIDEEKEERKNKMKDLKSNGFTIPVVERILRYRKAPETYREQDTLFDTYMAAIKPMMDKEAPPPEDE